MTTSEGVLLSRRIAYRGRLITLTLDRVRLPNGREVELEVVRHRGSVVLLAMPDASHVVLVRQYRYAINRWIWELPAGSLEEGEDAIAAATRECEEEIGLTPGVVEPVGEYYPTPGFCDESMAFFRLTELTHPKVAAGKDDDEELEPRIFALDEARELIRKGEIVDMKTALGLALVGQEGDGWRFEVGRSKG